MPSACDELLRREAAQLADRHGGAEHRDRAGRVEAAVAQVRMHGAADRGDGLVARDHRLDQFDAAGLLDIARRQDRRHHGATGMHRALGVAVVELDAVRGGAAEEGSIDQVGAAGAARHRHVAGGTRRDKHRLRLGRHVALRARDHHPDGVEQVAAGVVAHFLVERVVPELGDEIDDIVGRAFGGMTGV